MKIGKQYLWTAVFVLGLTPPLLSEPNISAKVSTQELALSDSLTLSLEVSGVSNIGASPNLQIPHFNIQRAGRTQSQSWINGKASSLVTFNFQLTPTKAGPLQIPPIVLNINGKPYSTKAIPINVKTASARSPASGGESTVSVPAEGLKPVFMTAQVDKKRVYVGEQILLTVQFLRRPSARLASQPRYSEPDMTGFLVENLKQKEYNTKINEQPYIVTELRYALFPTSDGEFAIGSAHIEFAVRTPGDPFDPNSFFQSFFGRSRMVKLDTRAIPIRARALPQNKPLDYSGAVGRYKLNAKVDMAEPEVGKPLNLIVTIEGVGNIKTLKEPSLPEMTAFRHYETLTNTKINTDGNFLNGRKEFKTLLIPQVSGQVIIPSLSFVYFSPDRRQFATAQSNPIQLDVKTGTLSQFDQESTPQSSPGQLQESVRVVDKDIRFIKSGEIKPRSPSMYQSGTFILINFFPPVFALGAILASWQNKRRFLNAPEYRAREAYAASNKTLKRAKRLAGESDPSKFYGALHNAVTGFIAAKFNISATGLVWRQIEENLSQRNIDPMLITRIREILDEADMARFASNSFSDQPKEMKIENIKNLLKDLNKLL